MKKVLLLMIFFLIPARTFASVAGEVNKANDLYKQGKFDDSLDLYQDALDQDDTSAVVNYDLGTALYKKGDYQKAYQYLEQAANDKNLKIKPKAEYNLGNDLYKAGMQKENTDVKQAIKTMDQALGQYGQTLAYDPKDQDAKFNEEVVKKEIERLKKQQQHKQSQQQNRQQQQSQQQNQQNQQQDQHKQQSRQNNPKNQEKQNSQGSQQQQSSSQQQAGKQEQQQSSQAQGQQDQKEFDRQQAQDLLEDYQENEQPKKLLSYIPKKIDDRPVLKDW